MTTVTISSRSSISFAAVRVMQWLGIFFDGPSDSCRDRSSRRELHDRTDKRPADATAILKAAAEMFPNTPVLFMRLGGALLAADDRPGAAAAYRGQFSSIHCFGLAQCSWQAWRLVAVYPKLEIDRTR